MTASARLAARALTDVVLPLAALGRAVDASEVSGLTATANSAAKAAIAAKRGRRDPPNVLPLMCASQQSEAPIRSQGATRSNRGITSRDARCQPAARVRYSSVP